ncbi:MAG: septum formation initiator family protein [Minisyncoccia bacterium]
MKNFQEKRRIRVILESRPALVVLFIVTIVFAWSMVGFIGKAEDASRNKKIAEDKIIELQKSKERFSSDIQRLQTDQGKEEAIREKFGLVKEGEELIVVVDDKNPSDTGLPKESGLLLKIKNWFR